MARVAGDGQVKTSHHLGSPSGTRGKEGETGLVARAVSRTPVAEETGIACSKSVETVGLGVRKDAHGRNGIQPPACHSHGFQSAPVVHGDTSIRFNDRTSA